MSSADEDLQDDEEPRGQGRRGRRRRRFAVLVSGMLAVLLVVVGADHLAGLRADTDADGLLDRVETAGWITTDGQRFVTDPHASDTDGDGLTDLVEAGQANEAASTVEYALFSNPLVPDSDEDGLTDAAEADLSLAPLTPDTDGDGLDDGVEVDELGTAADIADTDGDGFDDGYEVDNRESQGLDPLWADVKVDPWTYALDFAQGAVIGEIAPGDSLAWLIGSLVAGGSSFIPGVGWIIGSVADVRDMIGSAIHADWVGAGFSAIALLPIAGDATAVPAKVAKFIARHPELAATAGAVVVALKWLPDEIKVSTIRATSPEAWDDLLDAGATRKSLLRLQGGKVSISTLADGMRHEGHVVGAKARFFDRGGDGEKFLEDLYPDSKAQVSYPTTDCEKVCNAILRRVDVLVDGVAHESKVGRVDLTPGINAQIESDAHLVRTGAIEGAHWHFFASSVTNTVGASAPVLDLLRERGISFTIHVPA